MAMTRVGGVEPFITRAGIPGQAHFQREADPWEAPRGGLGNQIDFGSQVHAA